MEEYSDYEDNGIAYKANKELAEWTRLRLLEENCNSCCFNLKKIFTTNFELESPPRYKRIYPQK